MCTVPFICDCYVYTVYFVLLEVRRLESIEECAYPIEILDDADPFVQEYCPKVVLILHTVTDIEYDACLRKMEPLPSKKLHSFTKSSNNVSTKFILGTFGGYNAALVQTGPGNECRNQIQAAVAQFSNAGAIIGVGIAYGMDANKVHLGDVLISKSIVELENTKFNSEGKIIARGQHRRVEGELEITFCKNTNHFFNKKIFKCSDNRYSQAIPGIIISGPILVSNEDYKNKIWENACEAIGGEMEGFVLMDIVNHQPPERQIRAIIIKGVCDYADSQKRDDWHKIAALAAVEYAHNRLIETAGKLKFGKGE